MKTINIVLMGFGNVGKAFYQLLREKRDVCRNRYGLDPVLVAVFRSRGGCDRFPGFDEGSGGELEWNPGLGFESVLSGQAPGVMIECTPGFTGSGDPGLTHIRGALNRRWHVVTANKAPLVVDWSGLMKLAKEHHRQLRISGATAAALPTVDVAEVALAGTDIERVEGILNGTTNYILTQVREGRAFEEALREAQERGIAETDPRNDVEGWDTAYKILLLANVIFEADLKLEDIRVEGITGLSDEQIRSGRVPGHELKLLGRICRDAGGLELEVRPRVIEKDHPLFGVDNTEKGIAFWTDTMSAVTVIGGKSDPRATAAAMLKDLLLIDGGDRSD